jgi:dTDP-4-amino-4,6-dideoxygalactose transaminase
MAFLLFGFVTYKDTKTPFFLHTFRYTIDVASEVYYPLPPHLSVPCRKIGYKEGDFPHAELASRETLAIPIYPEMNLLQQNKVIHAVKGAAMRVSGKS